MNYLEAEDDGHGPVPMEVGAMKGKKGGKGRKGYGIGKYGKSFGKYDKNNEYSKNNEYGKGSEKGKEKRKGRRKKRTRKRREDSTKFDFPGLQQVMWLVGAQGERVLARYAFLCFRRSLSFFHLSIGSFLQGSTNMNIPIHRDVFRAIIQERPSSTT